MSGNKSNLESKTVATLLRSAPAGLIWIAGFLLLAGALVRTVYWAATFWPLYSGAVLTLLICAVLLVATAFGALRLFLMMTSGRDFLSGNQFGGWIGLCMSIAAFGYDLYDAYTAALKFDNDDPEVFMAMIGFIAAVHTFAFAMEVRLVMTMFSDVIERQKAEDRAFENLSSEYEAAKKELERKLLETQAELRSVKTEAEKQKSTAETEVEKAKRKAEAEAERWKQEAETERKLRLEAEAGKSNSTSTLSADLQRTKVEAEVEQRRLQQKQAELEVKIQKLMTEVQTAKTEVEQQKQNAEKWKYEAEVQSEKNRKLQEDNRNLRTPGNGSKNGTSVPGAGSEKTEVAGSHDPKKTEAIQKAIQILKGRGHKATQEVISELIGSENLFPGGISSKTVGQYIKALSIEYK
jgi:hypothetical protein